MPNQKNFFIHPTADVSNRAKIGARTKIWHQAQVREKANVGADCIIAKGVYVDTDVEIGDFCKLQNYVCTYRGVKIGNGVFVGPHTTFTNDLRPRAQNPEWKVVETIVEDGASIGANSTIICGVRIGANSMIGAGSLVAENVPTQALVYGNPAKIHGYVCKCGSKLSPGTKGLACKTCKLRRK